MKRSAASAWNYILSLESTSAGSGESSPTDSTSASFKRHQQQQSSSAAAAPPAVEPLDLLHLNDGHRLVIGMVGLPARGKTHVALKIANYFSWLGYAAKHFEVAASRRELIGAVESETFFDPQNEMGNEVRSHFRNLVIEQMLVWLGGGGGGQVAVYDTSNTTVLQRQHLKQRLAAQDSGGSKIRLIWIECACEDAGVIERNFFESTIQQDDFTGLSRDEAFNIFHKKMSHYETNYVSLDVDTSLDEQEDSFIKLHMDRRRVTAHNVTGYLETKLVSFCMNIHSHPRIILLSRHGQSEYNKTDRIGGDSDLTDLGREFGHALQVYCDQEIAAAASPALVLWTSSAKRTIQTVAAVQRASPHSPHVCWNALTEIDAGVCEGMTYKEVQQKMPMEYAERQKDKYHWRYPRGESYADVTRRLEPVIFELERQTKPVLVVAHRAVLRCLLGYFDGTAKDLIPHIPVPLHHVLRLESDGRRGWHSVQIALTPQVETKDEIDAELASFEAKKQRHHQHQQ